MSEEPCKSLAEILNSQDFDQLHFYQDPFTWSKLTHDDKELLIKLLVMQGTHLLKNGNSKGFKTFQTAREVSSQSISTLYAESEVLSEHKESIHCLQEAKSLLKDILNKDPTHFKAQYLLAKVLTDIALFEEDMRHFIMANKAFETSQKMLSEHYEGVKFEFLWKWGICLREMGKIAGEPVDYHLAIEKFRESYIVNCTKIEFLEDFGLSLLEFALLVEKKETFQEAYKLFKQVCEKDPNDFEGWYFQGVCLLRLVERGAEKSLLNEAHHCLGKAASIKPNDDIVWVQWGILELLIGKMSHDLDKIKSSLEKFKKAYEFDSFNPVVLNHFAEAQLLVGSREENLLLLESAKTRISTSLEICPNDPHTWYLYGCCFNELGKYYCEEEYFHRAIEEFNAGLEISAQDPFLYYGIACAYFALGEINGDISLLEKASDYCSEVFDRNTEGFAQFWHDWGVIVLRIGEWTEQTTYIKASLSKFDKALKNFFKTREISPTEIEWLYNYGYALDLLGEIENEPSHFEKAIHILQQVVKYDPHHNRARYNLALAYAHFGEIAQDIESYQMGIEQFQYLLGIDPEDDMVHMDYGVLLTHLGILVFDTHISEKSHLFYNQAEHHFLKSLALGNVQSHYHLAGLYSITGYLDQSMHYLEKAYQCESFPPIEDVLRDDWLENLRRQPCFWQLIRNLPRDLSEE